jgi:hypothetical protein
METGLFEIQADYLRDYRKHRQLPPQSRDVIHAVFRTDDVTPAHNPLNAIEPTPSTEAETPVGFARCFLRLANLPNFALDRLSRYETTLSRQVDRILIALEALDRRKPQERRWTLSGLPAYGCHREPENSTGMLATDRNQSEAAAECQSSKLQGCSICYE